MKCDCMKEIRKWIIKDALHYRLAYREQGRKHNALLRKPNRTFEDDTEKNLAMHLRGCFKSRYEGARWALRIIREQTR